MAAAASGGGLRAAGRRAAAWGPRGPELWLIRGGAAAAWRRGQGGAGRSPGRTQLAPAVSWPDSAREAGGPAAWLGWALAQSGAARFF